MLVARAVEELNGNRVPALRERNEPAAPHRLTHAVVLHHHLVADAQPAAIVRLGVERVHAVVGRLDVPAEHQAEPVPPRVRTEVERIGPAGLDRGRQVEGGQAFPLALVIRTAEARLRVRRVVRRPQRRDRRCHGHGSELAVPQHLEVERLAPGYTHEGQVVVDAFLHVFLADADDHVARPHAGLGGGGTVADGLDLGGPVGRHLDAHHETVAGLGVEDLRQCITDTVDGNRKGDVVGTGFFGGVQSDHLARDVQQRPPAGTGVRGGVGLDHVREERVIALGAAPDGADDALRHGQAHAERVAHGHDAFADQQAFAPAKAEGLEAAVGVDLQDRQVVLLVHGDDAGGELAAALEAHRQVPALPEQVRVGQDVPGRVQDQAAGVLGVLGVRVVGVLTRAADVDDRVLAGLVHLDDGRPAKHLVRGGRVGLAGGGGGRLASAPGSAGPQGCRYDKHGSLADHADSFDGCRHTRCAGTVLYEAAAESEQPSGHRR